MAQVLLYWGRGPAAASLSARAAEPPAPPLPPLSRHPFSSPQTRATPHYFASEKGQLPVVDRLIAARADVEAKTTVRRDADVVGWGCAGGPA